MFRDIQPNWYPADQFMCSKQTCLVSRHSYPTPVILAYTIDRHFIDKTNSESKPATDAGTAEVVHNKLLLGWDTQMSRHKEGKESDVEKLKHYWKDGVQSLEQKLGLLRTTPDNIQLIPVYVRRLLGPGQHYKTPHRAESQVHTTHPLITLPSGTKFIKI